jgi:hypothetical protein
MDRALYPSRERSSDLLGAWLERSIIGWVLNPILSSAHPIDDAFRWNNHTKLRASQFARQASDVTVRLAWCPYVPALGNADRWIPVISTSSELHREYLVNATEANLSPRPQLFADWDEDMAIELYVVCDDCVEVQRRPRIVRLAKDHDEVAVELRAVTSDTPKVSAAARLDIDAEDGADGGHAPNAAVQRPGAVLASAAQVHNGLPRLRRARDTVPRSAATACYVAFALAPVVRCLRSDMICP